MNAYLASRSGLSSQNLAGSDDSTKSTMNVAEKKANESRFEEDGEDEDDKQEKLIIQSNKLRAKRKDEAASTTLYESSKKKTKVDSLSTVLASGFDLLAQAMQSDSSNSSDEILSFLRAEKEERAKERKSQEEKDQMFMDILKKLAAKLDNN